MKDVEFREKAEDLFIGEKKEELKIKKFDKEKNSFSNAVDIVIKGIKEDPELWLGYKANIAMSFIDEAPESYRKEDYNLLWETANKGAIRFLEIWTKGNHDDK